MWRKLLYSGFHTPKAVTYHEPTVMWLFMIGHSLGRMETCFGPSTQGAGIRYQNTSQIQILRHFEKKGRDIECEERVHAEPCVGEGQPGERHITGAIQHHKLGRHSVNCAVCTPLYYPQLESD